MLVQIAPGDPVNAIVPADAPADVVEQVRRDHGLDKPLPVQFGLWPAKVVQVDLGRSGVTGRSVWSDLPAAISNTLMLALVASVIGFALGCLPGGPAEWSRGWEHMKHLVLPAVTLAVIPMGIVTRTARGIIAEIMNQEFVVAPRGNGLARGGIFLHVVKNAAPNALAVMGLLLGCLMGGSILVETPFSWPGTRLLLNNAIFQRDLPVLQGTILVLALVFIPPVIRVAESVTTGVRNLDFVDAARASGASASPSCGRMCWAMCRGRSSTMPPR
jgi:peptide/nickel transport system permease protein